MNCRDIELIVIKLAGNHLLEATARARAVAHIEACARCAARLAEERALWAGMRAVVAEIAQEEAPAHVKAALLEAFREQAAAQVEPTIIQSPARTRRWPQWMIAAAVAIVVLVLVASIFWRRSGSPNRRPEAQASILKLSTTAVVRPSPAQVNTTISEKPAPAQRQIARHPRRQRRHSAPSDLSETEVATDFFPWWMGTISLPWKAAEWCASNYRGRRSPQWGCRLTPRWRINRSKPMWSWGLME